MTEEIKNLNELKVLLNSLNSEYMDQIQRLAHYCDPDTNIKRAQLIAKKGLVIDLLVKL